MFEVVHFKACIQTQFHILFFNASKKVNALSKTNFKFSFESKALSSVESKCKVFKLSKTQFFFQIQNIFKCWEQVQFCFQIKERSHVPPQIWQSSSSSSHQMKFKVFKSNKAHAIWSCYCQGDCKYTNM